MYFEIPQHSWGLCQEPDFQGEGFYSNYGGPCASVALWYAATNRGAYAHWDVPDVLTIQLIEWLIDENNDNLLSVYTDAGLMEEEVLNKITEIAPDVQTNFIPIQGEWAFRFSAPVGPVELNDIPEEERENYPFSWREYWAGAPDWSDGSSTFSADIIINHLNGFFANYNGKYYFDFN